MGKEERNNSRALENVDGGGGERGCRAHAKGGKPGPEKESPEALKYDHGCFVILLKPILHQERGLPCP